MLYPSMFALAIVATTALIGIDQAGAQGPAGVVEQRIAAMKTNGAAMRTLVPLARG